MVTNTTLSQEESLALYEKPRDTALESNRFVVGRHQIDLPEEVKNMAIQSWLSYGWLTAVRTFSGAAAYQVPEKYRSYMPGAERRMSSDEQMHLMTLVEDGMKPDGSVRVSGIPGQGLWRLIDAGIITHRSSSSHRYLLGPAYPQTQGD